MALRTFLIPLVAIGLMGQPDADVGKGVEEANTLLKAAYNTRDVEGIRKGTTSDHLSITTLYQLFSQADQLTVVRDSKISSYERSDVRAIQLTKDVVLLTFRADIERTFRGKQTPPKVQVVEAWVRREGTWLQASYQETSLGGEPATDHVEVPSGPDLR